MKEKTKEQKKIEEEFSLFDNAEVVADIPSRIWFKNESKQKEMFDFFDKLTEEKTYRIKFPNVQIWKLYDKRLRFFAGFYSKGKSLIVASRSNDLGYFVFVKKKKVEDEIKTTG